MAGIPEHPGLASTVGVDWIDVVELELVSELVAFARYKTEFGGGSERNNGEAAVLAWASVHGGTVIVDDAVAARAARRDGISVHGTLWLVANGVRFGVLGRDDAEHIVDDLAATDMRLPVDGRGFLHGPTKRGCCRSLVERVAMSPPGRGRLADPPSSGRRSQSTSLKLSLPVGSISRRSLGNPASERTNTEYPRSPLTLTTPSSSMSE